MARSEPCSVAPCQSLAGRRIQSSPFLSPCFILCLVPLFLGKKLLCSYENWQKAHTHKKKKAQPSHFWFLQCPPHKGFGFSWRRSCLAQASWEPPSPVPCADPSWHRDAADPPEPSPGATGAARLGAQESLGGDSTRGEHQLRKETGSALSTAAAAWGRRWGRPGARLLPALRRMIWSFWQSSMKPSMRLANSTTYWMALEICSEHCCHMASQLCGHSGDIL